MYSKKNAKKASSINALSMLFLYLLLFNTFEIIILISIAFSGFIVPYTTWFIVSSCIKKSKKASSITSGVIGGTLSYFGTFLIVYIIELLKIQYTSVFLNKATSIELTFFKFVAMVISLGAFSTLLFGFITIPICTAAFFILTYKNIPQ